MTSSWRAARGSHPAVLKLKNVKKDTPKYTFGVFFAIYGYSAPFMPDEEQILKTFTLLIERHRKLIETLCLKASYGHPAQFCDMRQECYLEILTHMAEKEIPLSRPRERVWVYWQCRHAITRFLRDLKHFPVPFGNENPEETLKAKPQLSAIDINDFAALLRGTERRCYLMMVDGATDKEIEQALGLKHRSLIQMRHNIKKKLQQYIIQ